MSAAGARGRAGRRPGSGCRVQWESGCCIYPGSGFSIYQIPGFSNIRVQNPTFRIPDAIHFPILRMWAPQNPSSGTVAHHSPAAGTVAHCTEASAGRPRAHDPRAGHSTRLALPVWGWSRTSCPAPAWSAHAMHPPLGCCVRSCLAMGTLCPTTHLVLGPAESESAPAACLGEA